MREGDFGLRKQGPNVLGSMADIVMYTVLRTTVVLSSKVDHGQKVYQGFLPSKD